MHQAARAAYGTGFDVVAISCAVATTAIVLAIVPATLRRAQVIDARGR